MIRKLLIGLAGLILILILCLYFLIGTQLGLQTCFSLAKYFLPGQLTTQQLTGKLTGPLSIKQLTYKSDTLDIKLGSLKLNWAPVALLSHRLDIDLLTVNSLTIKQTATISKPKEEESTITNLANFKLPLQFTLHQVQLNNISYQQGNSKPTIIKQIELSAHSFLHKVTIKQLITSTSQYTLNLSGNTHVNFPFTSHLTGTLTNTTLPKQPITVNFSLNGNLNKSQLSARINKPFTATLQAILTNPLHRGPIKIDSNWSKFYWPLSKTDLLTSPQGKLTVNGSLQTYRIKLNTSLNSKQIPSTELHLLAHGNWQNLELDKLQANLLGGQINLTGKFNWQPNLSWSTKLTASNLNPAMQWHTRSGKVNFKATSSGKLGNTTAINFELQQLSGTLHQQHLSGHASIQKNQSGWFIKSLLLNAGQNHLTAHGVLGKHSKFSWQASLSDLSLLFEDDNGDIKSHGQISGSLDNPKIQTTTSLLNLNYNDITAKRVNLAANFNLHAYSSIKLTTQGLKIKRHDIHSLSLIAKGTQAHHSLELLTHDNLGTLKLALQGSYQKQQWHGLLQQLSFSSKKLGNWSLNHAVKLSYGEQKSIAPFCWQSKQASLCLQAQQWPDGKAKLKGSFNHFNIGLLQDFLPEPLTAISNIDAKVDLNRSADGNLLGTINLTIHQLATSIQVASQQQRIDFINSSINTTFDKQGLRAQVTLRDKQHLIPVNATLLLPNYHGADLPTSKQPLHAQLTANWPKLSFLTPLIPGIDSLTGQLNTQLEASGTLGDPKVKGNLQLKLSQVLINKLGLSLSKTELNLLTNGSDRLTIKGQLYSNGQPLQFNGYATLSPQFAPSELTIKGSNVPVIHNNEYKINLSPNLKLVYKAPLLDITGNVDIPYAKITPRDFTSTVELPNSVEFVNGEPPSPPLIQPKARIHVTLGNDNSIEYAGLTASLSGGATIDYSPQGVTTATGTLNVSKGGYEAYGQKLTINSGSLIYTGGPIDNPGINLVASKVIQVNKLGTANLFDNNNITVGIRASGRLDNPKISLFSSPSMSSTNVLSYLVFGQASDKISGSSLQLLSQAASALGVTGGDKSLVGKIQSSLGLDEFGIQSGQFINPEGGEVENNTSFVVGKKLSKRLFVSYSLGMVVPVNIFTARYQVFKNWAVQTDASQLGSGADILWTYETD